MTLLVSRVTILLAVSAVILLLLSELAPMHNGGGCDEDGPSVLMSKEHDGIHTDTQGTISDAGEQ